MLLNYNLCFFKYAFDIQYALSVSHVTVNVHSFVSAVWILFLQV